MAEPISRKAPPFAGVLSHPASLSLAEARAISLRSQGLAEDPAPFGSGKAAVLAAIQHLGYVQVDPINVIQRAHHHVLSILFFGKKYLLVKTLMHDNYIYNVMNG